MSEILVLSPGLQTTVQDLGRFGHQCQGVSPAGAMDRDALETANLLVGNARGEACLECTLTGPELKLDSPLVFSVCGAAMEVRRNGTPVPGYETLTAQAGDILSLGTAAAGLRAYIAIAGGFALEPVLNSRSTYARAGFGGNQGRPLQTGDRLPLRNPTAAESLRTIPRLWVPEGNRPCFSTEIFVRAILSHEASRFNPESVDRFFSEPYRVSPKSDRMGCRLEGAPLRHSRGADIISSGVQTGTVQVPGDGLPIVLLADRQTTGGYTRIAHVISVDLPLLGQARPGDTIRFSRAEVEEAQAAWRTREAEIAGGIREKETIGIPSPRPEESADMEKAPRCFRVTVNGRDYDVQLFMDSFGMKEP